MRHHGACTTVRGSPTCRPRSSPPIGSVRRSGLAAGRLWVKRDDCTGLATGGNKARKLELLVADALAAGADVLVSAGGLQSNHARTTAAAASRAGLDCVLAFNAAPPDRLEANQVLDVLLGAERRFLGPIAMDELNPALERIADELRRAGRRPYVIPIGGSSPLGASAYVAAADEIVADLGHDDVLVVTATGSGGTHAGSRRAWVTTGSWGSTSARSPIRLRPSRALAVDVAALVGLPRPSGEPWLVRDQVGERLRRADRRPVARALLLAARREGLLLDPVYSGKALAGLVALPPDSGRTGRSSSSRPGGDPGPVRLALRGLAGGEGSAAPA